MGIRYFQTFLNTYPIELLTTVSVGDEYLLIDGSEILYELYNDAIKDGRANYVEFRDHIMKFFDTLRECRIKPIVIDDGFKFEDNTDYYIQRRKEKIAKMKEVISGRPEGRFKRPQNKAYLCESVFKQTVQEMNIPWFRAKHNTDEDLAGLSRLLNASVLASDTIFCAYRLEAGWIPINSFAWKRPSEDNGNKVIKAKKFFINEFADRFHVTPEALRFLAVLFPQRNFDDFKKFRDANFKRVAIPPHLRLIRGKKFKRPNYIENLLIWFFYSSGITADEMTDRIVSGLEVTDEKAQEIRFKILTDLDKYDDPKLKKELLKRISQKIDDPECQARLETGMDDAEEDDTVVPKQVEDSQNEYVDGDFPDWARRLLINQDSGKPLVNFLQLILQDPEKQISPHVTTIGLRKVVYQVLFRKVKHRLSIQEYDRDGLDYKPGTLTIDSFPLDLDENDSMTTSRNVLLSTLIEEEEKCRWFDDQVENLHDDMKVTMAATSFWISKFHPSDSMVKSMAFLFSLMEIKQRGPEMKTEVEVVLKNMYRNAGNGEVDLDVLHWTSQWEVCFSEAITLNKLLRFPFPEPIIGKFFSASILATSYEVINSRSGVGSIVTSIDGFPELYRNTCDILF